MDDQYSFDINLDFLDNSGNPQDVVPEYKQNTTIADIESLAKRIASSNELILKLKASESKNTRLQKEQQDLRDSALSIQSLYKQEKAEKAKYELLASEWQTKCEHAESQLTNKTLHFEQLTSKIEQTNEKGPISYNELALKYHRLALHLEEEKLLNYKERASLQSIQEYIDTKKLTALVPLKKKLAAKKQVHDFSMQCNLKPDVKNQETSIDNTLPGVETRTQGTQYTWYTTTRGTNTPAVVETLKKPVETKSQATQYISSTTTRGTSTSTFIQKQSVGTNFPEVNPPIIEEIFKEMIYQVSPLSPVPECPLIEMENMEKSPIETKSVGTNTELRNVRKPIDYVAPNIKSSDSRPPSRNIYDRVKNESPFMGMPTFNPFVGFGLSASPLHNTMAELWTMLGHTIFSILNNGNVTAHPMNRNPDIGRRREQQRSRDDPTNSERGYYDEESRDYSSATRNSATSPTLPQDFDEMNETSFFEENYTSPSSAFVPVPRAEDTSNTPFEIPKILLSKSPQGDAVHQPSKTGKSSCVDEILKLFPEHSNSIPTRNAIMKVLKTSRNLKKERRRAKKEIAKKDHFHTLSEDSNLMMEQESTESEDSFIGFDSDIKSDEVFCKPFVPPKRKQTPVTSSLFQQAGQQNYEKEITPESDHFKQNERKQPQGGGVEKEKNCEVIRISHVAPQTEKITNMCTSDGKEECKALADPRSPGSCAGTKVNRKRVRSTPDLKQYNKQHRVAHSTTVQSSYSIPEPASQPQLNRITNLTDVNVSNPSLCDPLISETSKRKYKPSNSILRQKKQLKTTEQEKSINSQEELQSDSLLQSDNRLVESVEKYCDISTKRENQNKTDWDSNNSQEKPCVNILPSPSLPREKSSFNYPPYIENNFKVHSSLPSLDEDVLDCEFKERHKNVEPEEPTIVLNMKKCPSPIAEETDWDYEERQENTLETSASQCKNSSKLGRAQLAETTSSLSTNTSQVEVETLIHQRNRQAEPLNSVHETQIIRTELENPKGETHSHNVRTPLDLAHSQEGAMDYKISNQTDSNSLSSKQKVPYECVFQQQPTASGNEDTPIFKLHDQRKEKESVPKDEKPPECKRTPTENKIPKLFRPYITTVSDVLPSQEMANELIESKEHSNDVIQGHECEKLKDSVPGQQKQENYLSNDHRAVSSDELPNLSEIDRVVDDEKTISSNSIKASESDKCQPVEPSQRLTIEADKCTNNASLPNINTSIFSTSSSSNDEGKLVVDFSQSNNASLTNINTSIFSSSSSSNDEGKLVVDCSQSNNASLTNINSSIFSSSSSSNDEGKLFVDSSESNNASPTNINSSIFSSSSSSNDEGKLVVDCSQSEKTISSNSSKASEYDKCQPMRPSQRLTIEADECINNASLTNINSSIFSTSSSSNDEGKLFVDSSESNNASPTHINSSIFSSSSSSSDEEKLFVDCSQSPRTDLAIFKTPEKLTKTLPEFKTPDSWNSDDNFLESFIQNSRAEEADDLILNKILSDVAAPLSPISSIAPTEKHSSSEEESCVEPSKSRKCKRKPPATAAIAAKRCTKLSIKKAASTGLLRSYQMSNISDEKLRQCSAKRTQRKSAKNLDKGADEEEKVDGKVDIIDNIRLGFFTERMEEETPVTGLHESHKTVDDFNAFQQSIQDEEKKLISIADSEKVDSEFDINQDFQSEDGDMLNEMDISLESLTIVETTTTSDLVLEEASHPTTAFDYSPLSPPRIEQTPKDTHIIPETFERKIKAKPESNSMLSHIIANYNSEFHKIITQAQKNDKKLIAQLESTLTGFIGGVALPMDCVRTVDTILKLTANEIYIARALIAIVKTAPRPEVEAPPPVPELYLTKTLCNLLALLEPLESRLPNFHKELLTVIDQSLFSYSNDKLSLEAAMNLTQFYLAVIVNPLSSTNAARLFICKCLYFHYRMAIPMIYETLCVYPSVLPKRDDPTYDRSDALITSIQCVLMSTFYDQEKTDLKAKEMLMKLHNFYLYQSFKPLRDDVIENLIAKIRAGHFKNVSYAFVLICKRMEQCNTEKCILGDRLLPLANEYYHTISQTSENDEKIACVLECISFLIKPFNVNTDISIYTNLFGRFLNASDRQIIQEAAVAAHLRTIRFGYVQCFNAIYNFRPKYELTDKTKAMIRSFVYKKSKDFLRKLERQAHVLCTTT